MYGIDILLPAIFLLASGFFVILACRFTHISPIVGFLLAGLALGPNGIGFIEESETTALLAKLGLTFLLFDIGLHFSLKSARKFKADLLGLAPLQMVITGLILAFAITFIFNVESKLAMMVGLALALSSTAVAMQMISELKQNESLVGNSTKATLIFQDIVAIFLLIFADAFASDGALGMIVISALGKTMIAFMAAIILGQYILTPLMRAITRYDDPELFTVLSLLVVMATALATEMAGLSLTLGAFLAGMVMAETPFRMMLQNELRPFRGLLMALFFITVGMIVDPAIIMSNFDTIMGLVILIMAVKIAVIAALAYVFKRPTHQTIQLAFFLGQGSEFALVIFAMLSVQMAIGTELTQQLISAIAITMLLTPFMSFLAYKWSLNVCETMNQRIANCPEGIANPTTRQPVFIVGMNEVGKTLARAMQAHGQPYIAVDSNRQRFLEATAAGYIVAFGKPEDLRFWNTLGVNRARALCVATPRYEISRDIAPIVRRLYPTLKRYVAVKDSIDAVKFAAHGMIPFHSRGAPPGLEMADFLLREFGYDEAEIIAWSEQEQAAYLEAKAQERMSFSRGDDNTEDLDAETEQPY